MFGAHKYCPAVDTMCLGIMLLEFAVVFWLGVEAAKDFDGMELAGSAFSSPWFLCDGDEIHPWFPNLSSVFAWDVLRKILKGLKPKDDVGGGTGQS